MVGLFVGSTPLLVVKDPELMKDVLIKDFNCFAERTLTPVKEVRICDITFKGSMTPWRSLIPEISKKNGASALNKHL